MAIFLQVPGKLKTRIRKSRDHKLTLVITSEIENSVDELCHAQTNRLTNRRQSKTNKRVLKNALKGDLVL